MFAHSRVPARATRNAKCSRQARHAWARRGTRLRGSTAERARPSACLFPCTQMHRTRTWHSCCAECVYKCCLAAHPCRHTWMPAPLSSLTNNYFNAGRYELPAKLTAVQRGGPDGRALSGGNTRRVDHRTPIILPACDNDFERPNEMFRNLWF